MAELMPYQTTMPQTAKAWEWFKLVCRYCNSPNRPTNEMCTQCGAPLATPLTATVEDVILIEPPEAVLFRFNNIVKRVTEYRLVITGESDQQDTYEIVIADEEIRSGITEWGGVRQKMYELFYRRMCAKSGLPPSFFDKFKPAERGKYFYGIGGGEAWEL